MFSTCNQFDLFCNWTLVLMCLIYVTIVCVRKSLYFFFLDFHDFSYFEYMWMFCMCYVHTWLPYFISNELWKYIFRLEFHSRTTRMATDFFFPQHSIVYLCNFIAAVQCSASSIWHWFQILCSSILHVHCLQRRFRRCYCSVVCYSFQLQNHKRWMKRWTEKKNGNYSLSRPKKMDLIFLFVWCLVFSKQKKNMYRASFRV